MFYVTFNYRQVGNDTSFLHERIEEYYKPDFDV